VTGPRARLRIASYNLLHGIDLGQRGTVDLHAAAAVIAELDADIVALQEVDRAQPRSGGVDQVAVLADALGHDGVFAPALMGSPDDRWTPAGDGDGDGPAYGVGLLSRLPLTGVTRRRLPGGGPGARTHRASLRNPGWDREPRVALAAAAALGGRTLTVTVTHLSYLPWRAVRQLRSAAAGDGAAPHVLVGDLNLPPLAVRAATPAWQHAGGAAQFPSWGPRLQIHHVLLRGAVAADRVTVHGRSTSDHRPLVADLRLPD
jgi:endonuclease/exonuclease/phosphatase family metal-dependent hydrolase